MQKIILFDPNDNSYNILNITNHTSTRWQDTLEEAIEYDKISTRNLFANWKIPPEKSLEEVLQIIKSRHKNFKIYEIIDEVDTYEYW